MRLRQSLSPSATFLRSTACAAAISSKAIRCRHSSIIPAHLATASGVCVAWSSTPSDTGRKSSITGLALWRIAARIAVTVFCNGTKPADAPPTGDRYFGRPLRPAPVSWMKRAALAAAACAMARPSVSKAERQGCRVEIAGRHDGIVVGQHQRIVGGAVELGLDGVTRMLDRREQRAVDRRHAADRQRILQMSSARAVPPSSSSRNCCAASTCPAAGRAACRRGSRMLRLAPYPSMPSAAGLLLLAECRQCVSDDQRAMTGRHGGSIDQRQPVLGRERDRRKSGHRQRIAGRQSLAPILGFASRRSAGGQVPPSARGRRRRSSRATA